MQSIVRLYSSDSSEIEKFLIHFYGSSSFERNNFINNQWHKNYPNPIEIVDIIGAYVENIEKYNITMWVSIDNGVFIKVTEDNADELIRYLYERFPY